MSWMTRCDELGDRREPVELGNSVGSDVDAALTFKAVHGRVVNDPLDRAARERELDVLTELHCVVSLARKTDSRQDLYARIPLPPGPSGSHSPWRRTLAFACLAEVEYLCPKMI